ncbi:hypothetical protein BP1026B_II0504 [Burkholderia pseudomallei 1026b]|uniref:Uncharacterized protein n=1 Tax=Burkholderia pseudomallei (strain 1026b) TaxID=884204 RepID=A0A0H3HVA1_BURP2|nr:hypothetical protein BP1026B_II0504 [Burkholderia pseudomallei 1026b]EIF62015.1 hypothetical protein BP1026A_2188 [Burkholderia pseudomallei 1026a]
MMKFMVRGCCAAAADTMPRRRALHATVWGIRRLRSGAKTPLTFVAVRKNR